MTFCKHARGFVEAVSRWYVSRSQGRCDSRRAGGLGFWRKNGVRWHWVESRVPGAAKPGKGYLGHRDVWVAEELVIWVAEWPRRLRQQVAALSGALWWPYAGRALGELERRTTRACRSRSAGAKTASTLWPCSLCAGQPVQRRRLIDVLWGNGRRHTRPNGRCRPRSASCAVASGPAAGIHHPRSRHALAARRRG